MQATNVLAWCAGITFLLALSVTLYLGGWLYQSLVRGVREEAKA